MPSLKPKKKNNSNTGSRESSGIITPPATGSVSGSPTSPRSPKPKSTMMESVLQYYYNGVASISSAVSGETRLYDDVDCWVLGQPMYNGKETTQWASAAVRAVAYFTYRNKLPIPLGNGQNHDAGWGCMARTGQMMYCETLRRLHKCSLPPQSAANLPSSQSVAETEALRSPRDKSGTNRCFASDPAQQALVDRIQALFQDIPGAPFGIHEMTTAGERHKIPIGQWFSPTGLCRSLVDLNNAYPDFADNLAVIPAYEGVVPRPAIVDALTKEEKRGVLLLIPLMLGIGTLGSTYHGPILRTLELPWSMGIVGGKPKQSLYFVGHQGDTMFYLDPHVVQPAYVSPSTMGCRCGPRGTTSVTTLDPGMLLAFYFESVGELDEWEKEYKTKIHPMSEFPMFGVATKRPRGSTLILSGSTSGSRKGFNSSGDNSPPSSTTKKPAAEEVHNSSSSGLANEQNGGDGKPTEAGPRQETQDEFDCMNDFDDIMDDGYGDEEDEDEEDPEVTAAPAAATHDPDTTTSLLSDLLTAERAIGNDDNRSHQHTTTVTRRRTNGTGLDLPDSPRLSPRGGAGGEGQEASGSNCQRGALAALPVVPVATHAVATAAAASHLPPAHHHDGDKKQSNPENEGGRRTPGSFSSSSSLPPPPAKDGDGDISGIFPDDL